MGSRLSTRVLPERRWQLEQCGECWALVCQLQQLGVEHEHEHRGSPGERLTRSEAGRLRATGQYPSFGVAVQTHRRCDEDEKPPAASTGIAPGTWLVALVFGSTVAKTYNNLFDQVVDFDNLWQSYLAARKGKRYHAEVGKYTARLEHNLIETRDRLLSGDWTPGQAREFRVYEPKWRDIQAPPFADRVVHHALVRVVEPLFDRRFIHHSYACRTDKGAQRAVNAVQKMLRTATGRWSNPYVVKGDVSKYFASIDHEILFEIIRRVVSCKRTLALWKTITRGYGHGNGFGVPVGALTSQLVGNIVMDQFDHAMTDQVGAGMYVRYMDDFVVIAPCKTAAAHLLGQAQEQLAALELRLNPRSCYFPASRGVDFAGYRTWTTHILPRKRNIRKARRNFKRMAADYAAGRIGLDFIQPRIASFLAYTKHCQAADTVAGVLSDFTLQRSAQQ